MTAPPDPRLNEEMAWLQVRHGVDELVPLFESLPEVET